MNRFIKQSQRNRLIKGESMKEVGLILEGGGMRGVYTSGVLDFFMEKDLYFPYVIGVSAGACNAVSYVSKQKGRSKKATIDSIEDPKYMNYRNLFEYGSLLHMDMIFDEFPNKTIPFDYDTFFASEQECVIVTTNCITGKGEYFYKDESKDIMKICRASSSLPLLSPIVEINGTPMLDGGIADSIPIRKSIEDGNRHNVLVLTRDQTYRKKPHKIKWIIEKTYREYPYLQEAIFQRYEMYNDTLDFIEKEEKEGKAFVIRPEEPVQIRRMEKDVHRLTALYCQGYEDGKKVYDQLIRWLSVEG